MVKTWETIILVILGGGGILTLLTITCLMIKRGPPRPTPFGVPFHQHPSAQQHLQNAPAPAPTAVPARQGQGASDEIELGTRTQTMGVTSGGDYQV